MVARNDITGDLIKTKHNTQAYKDGIGRIYGDNRVKRGRYKQCKETGKMIHISEWNKKDYNMVARNDITGDFIKTKQNTQAYKEGIGRIYGDNPVKRGRYKQCKETGKMIHISEWNKKYYRKVNKAPMVFCSNFEPYQSMITHEYITSKAQHEYELARTGSRVYEGRYQEQKEADRYNAAKEEKLMDGMEETLNQTYHDIEHGYNNLEQDNEPLSWGLGDESGN